MEVGVGVGVMDSRSMTSNIINTCGGGLEADRVCSRFTSLQGNRDETCHAMGNL